MLGKILRSTDFKSLPALFWLAVQHPLFIVPTLKATQKTMQIAQREYGNAHNGNTKANAFRHALWNVLIAKDCLKWKKNPEKVLRWTEKITTKHEKIAPNSALERSMDLHNNAIGRNLCEDLIHLQDHAIISEIKKRAEKAEKVTSPEEIVTVDGQLVYITGS